MAFTRTELILWLIPPISMVPAKRVSPSIGVTATFASIKMVGRVIPVSLWMLIRYPFPACSSILIPNFLLNKGGQLPAAITNSSA